VERRGQSRQEGDGLPQGSCGALGSRVSSTEARARA
jgi:hypothetical protein